MNPPNNHRPLDQTHGSSVLSESADTSSSLRRSPVILVRASAPTRTADVGGWTDTWFARQGTVCNIAIDHRAVVKVQAQPGGERTVRLIIRMTGEDYVFEGAAAPGRHPIIEHAIVASEIPGSLVVDIADSVLAGSGLGTSASVMVALVAALAAAVGEQIDAGETAALAHLYETVTGKQSGIQDHAAAAWGGISRYDVRYPMVRRELIVPPAAAMADLSLRLHTVYFGAPHASSELHDEVIARLDAGHGTEQLDLLKAAGAASASALQRGDVTVYGASLTAANEAIESMHDGLVGDAAHQLAGLARTHGARGWKVNGAGGAGGSMAVLGPVDRDADDALMAAVRAQRSWLVVDAALGAPGVTTEVAVVDPRDDVWEDFTEEVRRQ